MRQKRIYAFLIDLLIVAVPVILLLLIGVFVLKTTYKEVFFYALGVSVLLLWLRDLPGGRSPGKYFMDLKITGASSTGVLVLRNIPLILLPLEALLYLAGQRRLGDVLAGTAVVEDEKAGGRQGTLLMAGVFVAALFVYLSTRNLVGSYIWRQEEYRIAEAFINASEEIKQKTGGVLKLSKIPKYTLNRKHGQADVKIETKAYGHEQNVNLIVYLSKKDGGEWAVQNFEYGNEE